MTNSGIDLSQFKLKVNQTGDRVSPHKPLLMLMTLARIQAGEPRLMTYQEIEPLLKDLLTKYSKSDAKTQHPEYPFWRLRSDMDGALWEIPREADLHPSKSGDVKPSELIALNVKAGLSLEWFEHLKATPSESAALAQLILDQYFPDSLHDQIRTDIGLATTWYQQSLRRRRDPNFARRILEIYRYSCAICGHGARIGHAPMGIEAAHIKWHSHNGPDQETNGIVLCSIHHKAFDSGAIGISDDHKIKISQVLNGPREPLDMFFLRHHDQPLTLPSQSTAAPAPEFIRWHWREIFRD
jgi:putative restriction endonuclease